MIIERTSFLLKHIFGYTNELQINNMNVWHTKHDFTYTYVTEYVLNNIKG